MWRGRRDRRAYGRYDSRRQAGTPFFARLSKRRRAEGRRHGDGGQRGQGHEAVLRWHAWCSIADIANDQRAADVVTLRVQVCEKKAWTLHSLPEAVDGFLLGFERRFRDVRRRNVVIFLQRPHSVSRYLSRRMLKQPDQKLKRTSC